MQRYDTILLDMDGVLTDFFYAAFQRIPVHYRNGLTMNALREGHHYDMATPMGMTQGEFWKLVDVRGFWLDMPLHPGAQALVDRVRDNCNNVVISSAPSYNAYCTAEKTLWLRKHFGWKTQQIMYGSQKHLMAKPGVLLIDDLQKNVQSFTVDGGSACLVPSTWNTHPEVVADAVQKTLNKFLA